MTDARSPSTETDRRYGRRGRLAPEPHQERLLRRFMHGNRFLWNLGMEERENRWRAISDGGRWSRGDRTVDLLPADERTSPVPTGITQAKAVSVHRQTWPWLAAGPFHVQQQVLFDLDDAWRRHHLEGAGRPTFWSTRDAVQPALRFPDGFRVDRHWITLPKLGRVRWHGVLPESGHRVTAVTVRREPDDRWTVSLAVAAPKETWAPRTGDPVAIDVGVRRHLTLSDDRIGVLPIATARERRLLRIRQRRVSRTTVRGKPSSRNRQRAQRALNRLRGRITDRIADARHKLTTMLARNHAAIIVEDLRLRNMTASAAGTMEAPGTNVRAKAGLNRALLELGHGETVRQLTYKTMWYGSRLIAVDPRHSSQTCAACGHVDKANRNRASFRCLGCGHMDDADHNAAVVLLQRGRVALAVPPPPIVPRVARKRVPSRRRVGTNAPGDTMTAGHAGGSSAGEPTGFGSAT